MVKNFVQDYNDKIDALSIIIDRVDVLVYDHSLTDWECGFLEDIRECAMRGVLTEGQLEKLDEIEKQYIGS